MMLIQALIWATVQHTDLCHLFNHRMVLSGEIRLELAAVSKCKLVEKWVKDMGLKWGAAEKLLHVSTHPPAIVF